MRRMFPWIALLTALMLLGTSGVAIAAEGQHAYVGNMKCKMCHLKESNAWAATKMSKAYDLLKPGVNADAKKKAGLDPAKDYTTDPKCLRCHTTGYGKPGGFVNMETTPHLAGVGCEMCHGAGGDYVQEQLMSTKNKEYKKSDLVTAGLAGTITAGQCTACHNNESPFVGKDYVFDFEARKTQGVHERFALKYPH
jgi:cytochrome c554/c'-like protein